MRLASRRVGIRQPFLAATLGLLVAAPGTGQSPSPPLAAAGEEALAAKLYQEGTDAFFKEGNPKKARPLHEQALAIRERLLGPNHVDVALSLASLGMCVSEEGDLPQARSYYDRAASIVEKLPDRADLLRRIDNLLAKIDLDEGRYPEARDRLASLLARHEQAPQPDRRSIATVLHNLGVAYYHMGHLDDALTSYQRALEIRIEINAEPFAILSSTNNLATAHKEKGDLVQARIIREQARRTAEEVLPSGHPARIDAVHNLAVLYKEMGDLALALPLAEEALRQCREARGEDHADTAYAYNILGAIQGELGDLEAGGRHLQKTIEILEHTSGPEHPELATMLDDLGVLRLKAADCAGARPILERALRIAERSQGAEGYMVGDVLGHLADAHAACGDHAAARAASDRSLEIRRTRLGAEHYSTAEGLARSARILADAGETPAALDAALEAERVSRLHFRTTLYILGERQALLYREARSRGLDVALSLLAREPSLAGQASRALDAVIRSRGLVRDELARRQRAMATSTDPEVVALARRLAGARQRLAHLSLRPSEDRDAAHRRRLDEARRDKEQAEGALALLSVDFVDEQTADRAGLRDIQGALRPGAALVCYVRYDRRVPRAGADYLAFVALPGDQPPAVVPIGEADAVDRLVRGWRAEMLRESRSGGRAARQGLRAQRSAGDALRRAVWDSVAARLASSSAVYLTPDGALSLVNFAALPAARGGYLIETGPTLHLLSVERDLVRRVATPGRGLLVAGDPDYEAATPRPPAEGPALRSASAGCRFPTRFDRLPASRLELRDVVGSWKTTSGEATALEGAQASETAVKRLAPGRRVLHLATHGFFAEADCDDRPAAAPRALPHASSLLRAGLALAGANRRSADDDGILTAEEVAAMNLTGVEWAVLSACDSGVGDVAVGEGVFGLQRAFRVAGVRTVIMSLWPVEDDSTRRLMAGLYRDGRSETSETAGVLRRAALEVIEGRRARGLSDHPFYWGGFVAAESGR